MASALKLLGKVTRKKILHDDVMDTPLRRCLSTFDLTLLGVGHMIGSGLFVLTGTVVRNVAGPGAVLSYLLAGVAAIFSSLCYAEFGSRVPKAGSAYTYTYVTIGELCAFIIGWNIILEHWLGIAAVARAWSGSFDAIFSGAVRNATLTHIGHIEVEWLSEYPDVVAFCVVLALTVFIACGAKASVSVNTVFTVINLTVIMAIILAGLSMAETDNWTNSGHGGFLPYGFTGVFAGAATCFYAYIGFEGIATAGEEAENPSKSIPIATGLAVGVTTVLYFGSSVALTLLVPYYDVDLAAPFPTAFAQRGLNWARVIIAVGTMFGISSSLIGALFSMPRSIYAMASDGLLFRCLSHVHPSTQTPLAAILISGVAGSSMALVVEIDVLVEFLSIGTLMSFTIVAASVLILRYQPANQCPFELRPEDEGREDATRDDPGKDDVEESDSDRKRILKKSQSHDDIGKLRKTFASLPVLKDVTPGVATGSAVFVMALFMVAFNLLVLHEYEALAHARWWSIICLVVFSAGIIASFGVLLVHETNRMYLTFQVPFVPFIPSLSMFINIAMMLKLNYLTWIRLAVWMTLGFFVYFGYGMWHSAENKPLSAYSHIVSYAGSGSAGSLTKMDESLHQQQPKNEIEDPGKND